MSGMPRTSLDDFGRMPWQLWVVVTLLAIEAVGNALFALRQPLLALYWLAFKVLFIVGLLRGWRPVFVLFLLAAGFHVLSAGIIGPFAALLNLVSMVLVASAFHHFFRPAAAVR